MKSHVPSRDKANGHSEPASRLRTASAENGLALEPPPYGVAFIDRAGTPSRAHGQDAEPRSRHSSAGANAVAVAPPLYRIDVIDRGAPGAATAQLAGAAKATAEGNASPASEARLPAGTPNRTGMPDRLKAGIEALSGFDLSDVRVHANSDEPAQLHALAYAQGNQIHLAPGQEKQLPHEAWHVVQQRQGRVPATMQAKGVAINDDRALEKEADVMGARAAATTVPAARTPGRTLPKASPVTSLKSVIQRNVGFEFELEDAVKTYQSGRFYIGYKPLSKRARILNGIDFYVEADGLPGGDTSWEFVTTDFPETLHGLARLLRVLNNIDGIVELLRNSPLTVGANPVYNPVNNTFLPYAIPVADRYYTITTTNFRAKPQVTAGFSLAALDEVLHSGTTAAGPGVSNLVRDTNSVDAFGQVPNPQPVDVPLGQMRAAADAAIGGVAPDPGLRALVTQLMQVIIAGRQNIGATPKTIMRLALGRTDMKAAFNTLSPLVRGPYEGAPNTFVNLVMTAVNAYLGGVALNDNDPVISGALFSDPQYAHDPRHNMPSPFTQVTRDQWLTQIATIGGRDLLSKDHYPVRTGWFGWANRTDRTANRLLASMGALHRALDPGSRPIFEIRSSHQIFAALITPYALDFFKYVRFLHDPGALTESAELTGLTALNLVDIIGFAPARAGLLQQMRQRALANFNA